MGKIKVKRKSTLIDMTAMSDVTVLLLTFFMLTSTFLQKEPVQVITPPSVSTDKVPLSNVTQVLVSTDDNKDLKIFLTFTGEANPDLPAVDENNPDIQPGMYASEPLRKRILENVVTRYENLTGENLGLDASDYEKFSKIGAFGVPLKGLKDFLNDPKQDEFIKEHMNDKSVGIPLTPNPKLKDGDLVLSEFQLWMQALLNNKVNNPETVSAIRKDGTGVAVKADRETKFSQINKVLQEMRDIKMNKFTVMTALAAE